MNEREELRKTIIDWDKQVWGGEIEDYTDIETLTDRILAAGFRKTLDVSELERWSWEHVMRLGHVDDLFIHEDDLRRLAAPKERWVACAERLPEEGALVLICQTTVKKPVTFAAFYTEGKWGLLDYEFKPTHWQPLPPPPTNPAQTAKEGV